MSSPPSSARRPVLLVVLPVALLALIALGVWLAMRSDEGAPPAPAADDASPPASRPAPRPPSPAPAPPRARPDGGPPHVREDVAADGVGYMPAGPDDPRPDGPLHPHPITAKHQRIYRENALLSSLSDAMDLKDVTKLRALLKTYREEYPEDDNRLQGGYQAIADCLEHPGPDARAAAQRYFDHELASTLRRFVKRYCLD